LPAAILLIAAAAFLNHMVLYHVMINLRVGTGPDTQQPGESLLPSQPLHILLIEDEPALARNMLDFLALSGHQTDYARDGRHGLQLALAGHYDLIVLDLMLPKLDGLTLCRQLRAQAPAQTPVLMLTARDTLDDKLQGFAAGADDYLTKPFALAELLARCEALGRRRQPADYCLQIGPLQLDRRRHQAWRDGLPLVLNPTCFRLLQMLAEHYPALVSRQQLSDSLWPDEPPDSDSLRSHLYLLRQQLDKPFAGTMLHTVHGVGVQLRVPDDTTENKSTAPPQDTAQQQDPAPQKDPAAPRKDTTPPPGEIPQADAPHSPADQA
jgi:DNA-binding response OmpR family regulator